MSAYTARRKNAVRSIPLLVLLLLEACNLPRRIPTDAPPRKFIDITSPHDGDILSSLPVSVDLRMTTLGGGAQSVVLEQASALAANNHNYGPFPLDPGLNRQTLTVPRAGVNSDEEFIHGLLTFTGRLTLRNGTTIRSNPVTVCVTYIDKSISSPMQDHGYVVLDEYYCLPALFPPMSTNEWARRIYVESVLQLRGDRCLPANSGGGLLIQILAETTASHRVGRVAADIRYFGAPSFGRDTLSSGLEMTRVGGAGDFWELAFPIDVGNPDSLIPEGYTMLELTVRAYDIEGIEQASDTTVFPIPPCRPESKQDVLLEATATPGVPVPPTKEKRKDEEPAGEPPSDPPAACPPTVYCGS
jgi:hypothetical protein